MVNLQHILIIINLKQKINAYFAATSTIWKTVRNTWRRSIEEKIKLLMRKKLCYRCYKPVSMSHNARTCSYRRICQIRKKKHPTGLHGYNPKQKDGDYNSSASGGTQNVTFKNNCVKFHCVTCNASCSDNIVSMCIVSLKIKYLNKRKKVTTYTLLDNCSQGTFVREDIIHNLDASGARTKITVKTLNGGQTHLSTALDGLEVSSNNKSINEHWIKLQKCYTTSDLPIDVKEVATNEKLRKQKYLDHISKKT